MYCRICHYDLRGLDTPRCPECGRSFAPGDPGTFLTELPTLRSALAGAAEAFRTWCRTRRISIIIFAAAIWLASFTFAIPSFFGTHCGLMRSPNLKLTMTTWLILQNESPAQARFNKAAARDDMPPSLSTWTEYSTIESRRKCSNRMRSLPVFGVPLALFAGLVAVLWSGKVRKGSLIASAVCLLTFFPSAYHAELGEFFYPGTYDFLDDYVYIDGVDFHAPPSDRGTTIAAYDWRTFEGDQRRLIAFADGHVEFLDSDKARALIEAQGIPFPYPDPPSKRDRE